MTGGSICTTAVTAGSDFTSEADASVFRYSRMGPDAVAAMELLEKPIKPVALLRAQEQTSCWVLEGEPTCAGPPSSPP